MRRKIATAQSNQAEQRLDRRRQRLSAEADVRRLGVQPAAEIEGVGDDSVSERYSGEILDSDDAEQYIDWLENGEGPDPWDDSSG